MQISLNLDSYTRKKHLSRQDSRTLLDLQWVKGLCEIHNDQICLLVSTIHCPIQVADFLFIVTPIVGVCNCSLFWCSLLYVHSSIAIILMGKRELVALLNLSSWCLVMVEWLFLVVPWGRLRFVIVVFSIHTHYFC